MGKRYRDKVGGTRRRFICAAKTGVAYPVRKIGDHVKHTYRKHNREADHTARLGAEGGCDCHRGDRQKEQNAVSCLKQSTGNTG